MIENFAKEKGITAGFSSDKPVFIPNPSQFIQALHNFKSILMEKTRATTPDITLLELGSSGVTDLTIPRNSVDHVPAVGLATSTVTPTNFDINITLDPKLRLLILTKDGYDVSLKVDCQFVNWPFDENAFSALDEAPTESITPIDPLPEPEIVPPTPIVVGEQFVSIQTLSNGAKIDTIPAEIQVMAVDSSQEGFVELYINGQLHESQPLSAGQNGIFTFTTDPTTVYSTSKTGVGYYAVLVGGGGNLSSSTSEVKFSSKFISPE